MRGGGGDKTSANFTCISSPAGGTEVLGGVFRVLFRSTIPHSLWNGGGWSRVLKEKKMGSITQRLPIIVGKKSYPAEDRRVKEPHTTYNAL